MDALAAALSGIKPGAQRRLLAVLFETAVRIFRSNLTSDEESDTAGGSSPEDKAVDPHDADVCSLRGPEGSNPSLVNFAEDGHAREEAI